VARAKEPVKMRILFVKLPGIKRRERVVDFELAVPLHRRFPSYPLND
jgi:hypothetical protein